MPEVFDTHGMSSVADITNHIEHLRESMDQFVIKPVGDSSSDESESDLHETVLDDNDIAVKECDLKHMSEESEGKNKQNEKCSNLKAKHIKNSLIERRAHSNLHKRMQGHGDSTGDNTTHVQHTFHKKEHVNHTEHFHHLKQQMHHSKEHSNHTKEHVHYTKHHTTHTEEHEKHAKHANHAHHATSLSSRGSQTSKDKKHISKSTNNVNETCEESMNAIIHCYDAKVYQPIIAGQCKDDVDVPIMSPPSIDDIKPIFNFDNTEARSASARYNRAMTFNILMAGESTRCDFNIEIYGPAVKSLNTLSEKANSQCLCSSKGVFDDVFGGWDVPTRSTKSKFGKRRKTLKPSSSEIAFNRLTGGQYLEKDDPAPFKHSEKGLKYIERYRFFHTVGRVGRPVTGQRPVSHIKKTVDIADHYYNKMKTICTMASATDLYNLFSSPQPRENTSSDSSNDSTNGEANDDEESSVDARPYSMKDRGKALNLAPVRETPIPSEYMSIDQMDQYQKNRIALDQYLNLTTPPVHCLQLDMDDVKSNTRYGRRSTPTGDPYTGCTPRRGVRTLRLGSAEFMKPGTGDQEVRWSCEKRVVPRAATFHSSSVPGTLIVGSTVITQSTPVHQLRAKSGGNKSPFVQFQKEYQQQQFQKPQTPPQHISGKKFKPCERYNDLSPAKERDRGRLVYTHSSNSGKSVVQCHTATVVDLKETPPRRNRVRPIMLDVNHLGIRGRPFKSDDQITVLYKNRHTASLTS